MTRFRAVRNCSKILLMKYNPRATSREPGRKGGKRGGFGEKGKRKGKGGPIVFLRRSEAPLPALLS